MSGDGPSVIHGDVRRICCRPPRSPENYARPARGSTPVSARSRACGEPARVRRFALMRGMWRRKEHLRRVNARTGSAPPTMGRSTAHTWYARLLACVVVIAGVLAVAAPALAVAPPPDVDDPPMTL